jgi:type VI secretion system protein ImpG
MFDPAAVPVVNLFERPAEPVRLDHRRESHRLHPDLRRADSTEIHSVLSVTALATGGESFPVPHYFDRDPGRDEAGGLCWQLRLSPSPDERGTVSDLYLLGGEMDEELTLAAQVLCTNRHWATHGGCTRLSAETEIPAAPSLALPPSPQRDPVWTGDERWRLVSNFALAQESLGGSEGLRVLKNILTQYVPPGDTYSQRQIAGVTQLASEIMFHPLRPSADHPLGGLVRGLNIDLELDEDAFRGGSPFIFANVLEVFMGLRSAVNHVTRLRLFLEGRKGIYHQWPPRCGDRPLL